VRWTVRGQHNGVFFGLAPTGKPVHLTGINIYRIAQRRIVSNQEQVNIQDVPPAWPNREEHKVANRALVEEETPRAEGVAVQRAEH
jgi:hypothetical protein